MDNDVILVKGVLTELVARVATRRREGTVGIANDGSPLFYTQQSAATTGIAVGAVSTHARSDSHLSPIMTLSEKRKEDIIMANCGRYHVKYVDPGMPKKERDFMHNDIKKEKKNTKGKWRAKRVQRVGGRKIIFEHRWQMPISPQQKRSKDLMQIKHQ